MMALVDFLNSTTDNYRATAEATDLIYKQRRYLELLKSKGTVKSGVGGIESRVPWETSAIGDAEATSVFGWDGEDKDLPTYAKDDLIESGSFPWYYAGVVTFQVESEGVKNMGKAQWMDIAKIRYDAAVKRFSKYLEEALLLNAGSNSTTDNIQGLPTFMNNSEDSYGAASAGLDLTDADFGPKIVAVGAPLADLSLDHINQAFSDHADGSDSWDAIIGPPTFLQQMRTLVMPDQVYNEGGGTWKVGPLGINWFGVVPINTTRYLPGNSEATKKIYCLKMETLHLEFAWPGDGIKSTGWYELKTKVGTMVLVLKVALRSFCTDPWRNALITYS
jgi:hypothetical protein